MTESRIDRTTNVASVQVNERGGDNAGFLVLDLDVLNVNTALSLDP